MKMNFSKGFALSLLLVGTTAPTLISQGGGDTAAPSYIDCGVPPSCPWQFDCEPARSTWL